MGETTIDLGIPDLDQVKVIGSGGSAVVYRALLQHSDDELPAEVAIKVLKSSWDPNAIRRFEREQRAMRTLAGNPGFVPILETGTTTNGAPYFMMPFYEGGSLHEKISRHGPIDWPRALRLIEQVAITVDIAHDNDVLHRDLKPGNILLSADGDAHVTDFGISLISSESADGFPTTSTAFTPAYSPPESFTNAEKPSPSSDVYGLAATLWALLAGHAPFKAPGEQAAPATVFGRVAMQQVGDLRDRIPSPICRFIEESMAKEPADRPQSVSEFLDMLAAAREDAYRGVYAPRLELNTPQLIAAEKPEPDYVRTRVVSAPIMAFDHPRIPGQAVSPSEDATAPYLFSSEQPTGEVAAPADDEFDPATTRSIPAEELELLAAGMISADEADRLSPVSPPPQELGSVSVTGRVARGPDPSDAAASQLDPSTTRAIPVEELTPPAPSGNEPASAAADPSAPGDLDRPVDDNVGADDFDPSATRAIGVEDLERPVGADDFDPSATRAIPADQQDPTTESTTAGALDPGATRTIPAEDLLNALDQLDRSEHDTQSQAIEGMIRSGFVDDPIDVDNTGVDDDEGHENPEAEGSENERDSILTSTVRVARRPESDFGQQGLAAKPSWPWPILLTALVVITAGLLVWTLTSGASGSSDGSGVDIAPAGVTESGG